MEKRLFNIVFFFCGINQRYILKTFQHKCKENIHGTQLRTEHFMLQGPANRFLQIKKTGQQIFVVSKIKRKHNRIICNKIMIQTATLHTSFIVKIFGTESLTVLYFFSSIASAMAFGRLQAESLPTFNTRNYTNSYTNTK